MNENENVILKKKIKDLRDKTCAELSIIDTLLDFPLKGTIAEMLKESQKRFSKLKKEWKEGLK